MIFISSSWSPNMVVGDHYIVDFHKIDEELFKKYSEYAHSCMNKVNLAKILNIKYNPEHVQLRSGDALIVVHIKGGKLSPHDDELPDDIVLEYYCYNVYSSTTHVIIEKDTLKEE